MRQVMILGLGHVGKALAQRLRVDGVRVVGTTTTADKIEGLREFADEVHVLRGSDVDLIRAAARDCDAIVVTVAPNVRQARNREEREATYRDALVTSCESAAAACSRVVFLSSFSVYGDGGEGEGPVDENSLPGNEIEPSARYYRQAEQAVLASPGGCVLRLPDIYGAPGDLGFADRARLAHEIMGGQGPFSSDALLYIIHFEDVVEATRHALEKELSGIYNICNDEVLPRTNEEVFGELCRRYQLPPLQFLGQIKAPTRRISARKIHATGYRPVHTDPDYPLR